MLKTIENRILNFVDTLEITRSEIVHGTLYVKLDNDRDCDDVHAMIRTFYRTKINPTGGVNMYAVGDEFAFDFVPEDRETPVFTDEEENGVWSEFAEEGLEQMAKADEIAKLNGTNELDEDDLVDAQIDIAMNLEAESKEGK
jgi:hypothetical protein